MAAVLTLSVGIAVTTSAVAIIYSVVLRPLPFLESKQLVSIGPHVSWGELEEVQRSANTLQALGGYRKRTWQLRDSYGAGDVVLSGMITRGFFATLRVVPLAGLPFSGESELPGANRVVWVSHKAWTTRYHSAPSIIGATVWLNDQPYRIAGVLPPEFSFSMEGENPDIYIPLDRREYCCDRETRTLSAIGRLSSGRSREDAAGQVSSVLSRKVELTDLRRSLIGTDENILFLLGVATLCVMLVAVTNAAALMLARSIRNTHELAIRLCLGAHPRRLLREHLGEGLTIGLVSSVFGVTLGRGLLLAAKYLPGLGAFMSRAESIAVVQLDWTVVGACVLIALAAGTGSAVAPLAVLRITSLESLLRRGASESAKYLRVRKTLVIVQISFSCALLGASAFVLGDLLRVLRLDHGFVTDHIAVAGIGVPEARYDTEEKVIQLHDHILTKLRSIPSVHDAGLAAGVPFGRRVQFSASGELSREEERPWSRLAIVSPTLPKLLGISLAGGRFFDGTVDRANTPLVALVNSTFASRFQHGVGSQIRLGYANGSIPRWSTFVVVGVVGDIANRSLDAPPEPQIFLSSTQVALDGGFYFVRSSTDASFLGRSVQQAIWNEDPILQKVSVRPFSVIATQELRPRWSTTWLLSVLGGAAAILSFFGLAAVMSNWVTECQPEIAVRLALGGSTYEIVAMVLQKSVRTCCWGLLVGGVGTLAIGVLFRVVTVTDSALIGGSTIAVTVAMVLCSVAAAALPAYRAGRCDPLTLLRRT